jgi:cystathionine beta-lyase
MEVPDLPAICKAAHERGVLVALDNTWSAGLALRGFDLGVDIIMQALTKYQSGGSDVLMGAVITRDRDLHDRISLAHMRLGMGVGADDAYLVSRGLPTMRLRFEAHDAAARKLAAWLQARPEIQGAASGLRRLSRSRNLEARLQRRRRPVLGHFR